MRAPLQDVSRTEARAAYQKIMNEKSDRIAQLRGLLESNGVVLRGDDAAIQGLNHWFRDSVEEDVHAPGRLASSWYSVCNDLGLFLGDTLIQRCPRLHWAFFTGRTPSVSFQRHVVMGFPEPVYSRYNVDFDALIVGWGHLYMKDRGADGTPFLRSMHHAEQLGRPRIEVGQQG